METAIVTVVGASGTLGSHIVAALLDKGARVRAMVRATSDHTELETLGVTDFVVADLNDAAFAPAGFDNPSRAPWPWSPARLASPPIRRARKATIPGRTSRAIGTWLTRPRPPARPA